MFVAHIRATVNASDSDSVELTTLARLTLAITIVNTKQPCSSTLTTTIGQVMAM